MPGYAPAINAFKYVPILPLSEIVKPGPIQVDSKGIIKKLQVLSEQLKTEYYGTLDYISLEEKAERCGAPCYGTGCHSNSCHSNGCVCHVNIGS